VQGEGPVPRCSCVVEEMHAPEMRYNTWSDVCTFVQTLCEARTVLPAVFVVNLTIQHSGVSDGSQQPRFSLLESSKLCVTVTRPRTAACNGPSQRPARVAAAIGGALEQRCGRAMAPRTRPASFPPWLVWLALAGEWLQAPALKLNTIEDQGA